MAVAVKHDRCQLDIEKKFGGKYKNNHEALEFESYGSEVPTAK